jgi:hypothetical protein
MLNLNFLKSDLPECGYHLKYLFTAELFNHSIIQQNPDDKPRFAPSGSAFTDVVPVLDQIKRFSLVSVLPMHDSNAPEGLKPYLKIGEKAVITIDLQDGHCEINGEKIFAPAEVPEIVKFKLIYYRTVGRQTNLLSEVKKTGIFTLQEHVTEPRVDYVMGWQYLAPNGKTRKWEMKLT